MRCSAKKAEKLLGRVRTGDRAGAKQILNFILAAVVFQDGSEIDVLKSRMLDLLGSLSRAAVKCGGDESVLEEKNTGCVDGLKAVGSLTDLCMWIGSGLNDFVDNLCVADNTGKLDRVKTAIEFIDANFERSIGLADIACVSLLSATRMSHLFREQMGMTVVSYVTKVRVDHAKRLLLTTDRTCARICYDVGFKDQSFFSRTFKKLVGLTPLKFRESEGPG